MTLRRNLEVAAILGLAVLGWITWHALTGAVHLPDRIPMHFDVAGNVNGWASAGALWLLPGLALGLWLLMTLVARFPGSFNYPVQVTAQNQAALEALAQQMIAWIKAELVWMFCWMQGVTLQIARGHATRMPAGAMPVTLAVVFGTIGWHIWAMVRAARPVKA